MAKTINILFVEDEIADARLVVEEFRDAGYEVVYEVVSSLEDFASAAGRKNWDVILCDYNLPGFDAFKVLEIAKQMEITVPIIILSGYVGEDMATALMRAGAGDFISKDNLARLIPAVEREIKNVDVQLDRIRKENLIRKMGIVIDSLMAATPDLVSIKDRELIYQNVNSRFCKFFGVPREKVKGKTDFDIFPEQVAKTFQKHDVKVLMFDQPEVFDLEVEGIGGKKRFFHTVKMPLYDPDGHTIGILTSMRDITRLKVALESLRENEERYRRLVEVSPDGIIVVVDGKIVFANTAAVRLMGGERDEDILGMPYIGFIHPDIRALEEKRIESAVRYGEPQELVEEKLVNLAGEVMDIETSAVPILWQNQTAVQIVFRDITKRKRAEEAMLKSQKLESLAVLAGGIGHDFNNMLAAMLLQLTKMKKALAGGRTDVLDDLDNCEAIINRARDLTRQLLTFAEGGAPILRPCSLRDVVRQTVSFVMSGSKVRCEIDLPPDLSNIRGDENQISQVISNLLINAIQAMPAGGVIKVVGRNILLGPSNQYNLKPGDYVELVVADNGPGIPPEILPRIFDPYFTTKERGTGLGLAIVYSVVKKHKGHISVDSKPGKGTVFKILLPATEEKVPQAVQKDSVPDRGEGKILVMDDEPDIRELIAELLREYGYEVDSAADGQEAVEKYARALEEGKPYDVVVLDLTVAGGLGGKETLEKLKQIDPDVKALLSSGYSNDPIIADYKKYGFAGVVQKPYRIEVLHKTIYSLIAEKKGKKFSPER